MHDDALFHPDGDTFLPGSFSIGPWDPTLLHGGPPSALMAHLLERHPAVAGFLPARLVFDLLRPVPAAALKARLEVVREGRKARYLLASLSVDGTEVARCNALFLRQGPEVEPRVEPPAPTKGPEAATAQDAVRFANPWRTFVDAQELRFLFGHFRTPGPAAAWFRLSLPLLPDIPASPLARIAATADFTNGISAILPFESWSFINADLTLQIDRLPEGEWLLSEAETRIGAAGIGHAHARLSDRQGPVANVAQSLIFERRPSP